MTSRVPHGPPAHIPPHVRRWTEKSAGTDVVPVSEPPLGPVVGSPVGSTVGPVVEAAVGSSKTTPAPVRRESVCGAIALPHPASSVTATLTAYALGLLTSARSPDTNRTQRAALSLTYV